MSEGFNSKPAAEIIYDDDHVRAIVQAGSSPILLVMFAPADYRVNGKNFWGMNFVSKAGFPALALIGRQPTWFPASSIRNVHARATSFLKNYQSRVTYGFSMGAYAALKYGSLFEAQAAVALSPQYTINPATLGQMDRRFVSQYDPVLHPSMGIQSNDVAERCFVLFDPLFPQDLLNVDLLKSNVLSDRINLFHMYCSQHETIHAFASTPLAKQLITSCLKGDTQAIRATIAAARRANPRRRLNVISTLLGRKLDMGIALLGSFRPTIQSADLARLLSHLSAAQIASRRLGEAKLTCIEHLELSPEDARVPFRISDICYRMGDLQGAAKWAERSLAINPNDRQVLKYLEDLRKIGSRPHPA